VVIPPYVPVLPNSIGALKSKWNQEAQAWIGRRLDYAKLFTALTAVDLFTALGGTIGVNGFSPQNVGLWQSLTSNFITTTLTSDANNLALLQTTQMVNHYLGLAADPPDLNFGQLSPLAAAAPVERLDNDPLRNAMLRVTDNLRFESALADGLLNSMQRYEG